MIRRSEPPLPLDEIEAMARAALARLPAQFATHLGDVVLRVEDFADDETLAALGIEDPFDLTGHLRRRAAGRQSAVEHSGRAARPHPAVPPPILDEWIARGDETLEHLVAHVLVHEVGHHFGLSDEAMHALEEESTVPKPRSC